MKLKVVFLCFIVVLLLSACSKSSKFPSGSQDVNISQEQKGVTLTLKSITYSNGSPTPNYNGMRVVFDISNKSSNTLVIQGSVDSQKGKDLTVITIGDQQFLPTGWQQDPNKAINPDDKDREYTIPGGFLTAIWEYSVIFDTLSPPNFIKPIKCKIRGTLGNEKIEFVFDLPSPPK